MDIGQKLQQKRKSLNKSLKDIHDQTRINTEHLRLLESNNFTFLPQTYVKSFLRDYGNALGFDSSELLQALDERQQLATAALQQGRGRSHDGPPVSTQAVAGLLEWSLILGTIVLIVSIAFTYFQYRSQDFSRTADTAAFSSAARQSNGGSTPFELHISHPESVTVAVVIGDVRIHEEMLTEGQKSWQISGGELEFLVKNARDFPIALEGTALDKIVGTKQPVRVILTRATKQPN